MLVSHRKRFIFLKPARTAGTSVEVFFEPWCRPPGAVTGSNEGHESDAGIVGRRGPAESEAEFPFRSHLPAADIKRLLKAEVWDTYYRFATVRDPFDRHVSLFWHRLLRQDRATYDRLRSAPLEEVKAAFRPWLLSRTSPGARRHYTIDRQPILHARIRFEHLAADISAVCEAIGVDASMLSVPQLKVGQSRSATGLWDAELAEHLISLRPIEFSMGYSPDAWRQPGMSSE